MDMNSLREWIEGASIHSIDQGIVPSAQQLSPFALTDTLTTYSGEQNQPFVHLWQLDQTMILGMKDTRVPHFDQGIAALQADGYRPIIRNSGGLGVIADQGVLNLSLILPQSDQHKLAIDQAYTFLWDWLRCTFETPKHVIEAYEIQTSYCPGTFDLSIGGKKFAGIAQRRVKRGIAIMAYLSVNGDQLLRGEVVRRFYQKGLADAFGKDGYPPVDPHVMANLDALLGQPLTVATAKDLLLQSLQQQTGVSVTPYSVNQLLGLNGNQADYDKQREKMLQRNLQLQEDPYDLFL